MTQHSALKHNERIIIHVDPEIADLVPGFLENRRKDIKTMDAALKQGDFETIQILGHSMKGAGGSYGFDAVTDIGKSLEDAAKNNNAEEIQRSVGELAAYLDRVEVIYE
ncbi:MAG: Hpt domain-containing protein [Deltaproteobacteria bacterium]|nr:Hpt domain-containing protein [Deltaproteobacteria bacterium]